MKRFLTLAGLAATTNSVVADQSNPAFPSVSNPSVLDQNGVVIIPTPDSDPNFHTGNDPTPVSTNLASQDNQKDKREEKSYKSAEYVSAAEKHLDWFTNQTTQTLINNGDNGSLDEAEKLFRESIAHHVNVDEAQRGLARVKQAHIDFADSLLRADTSGVEKSTILKRAQNAIGNYKKALEIDPENVKDNKIIYKGLGNSYKFILDNGVNKQNREEYFTSVKHYENALEIDPNDKEIPKYLEELETQKFWHDIKYQEEMFTTPLLVAGVEGALLVGCVVALIIICSKLDGEEIDEFDNHKLEDLEKWKFAMRNLLGTYFEDFDSQTENLINLLLKLDPQDLFTIGNDIKHNNPSSTLNLKSLKSPLSEKDADSINFLKGIMDHIQQAIRNPQALDNLGANFATTLGTINLPKNFFPSFSANAEGGEERINTFLAAVLKYFQDKMNEKIQTQTQTILEVKEEKKAAPDVPPDVEKDLGETPENLGFMASVDELRIRVREKAPSAAPKPIDKDMKAQPLVPKIERQHGD